MLGDAIERGGRPASRAMRGDEATRVGMTRMHRQRRGEGKMGRIGQTRVAQAGAAEGQRPGLVENHGVDLAKTLETPAVLDHDPLLEQDRKSVVEGKGVSVRVDHGGGSIITKKNQMKK